LAGLAVSIQRFRIDIAPELVAKVGSL